MTSIALILCVALASLQPARCEQKSDRRSVVRQEGFVPDEKTAIAIAIAVWIPIYGEKQIQSEKPYKAILRDGVWHVWGSTPNGSPGGVALAEISKTDARIIRIIHGK